MRRFAETIFLLMFSFVAHSAFAGSILTATPDPVSPGSFITLTASIDDSAPFAALTLEFEFDPTRLSPGILSAGSLTGDFSLVDVEVGNTVSVFGFTAGVDDVQGPGGLFTMTFLVLPGALPGAVVFDVHTAPGAVDVPGERQFAATASVTILDTGPPVDVPEPATAAILALGLLATAAVRRRG